MDGLNGMNNSPLFSIVIPCLNEAAYLPDLFRALRGMDSDGMPYEVILVDNGSSDGSIEIARSHGARVFADPRANISGLRNIGAAGAGGRVFAFLDADCIPSRNWLKNAAPYLDDDRVGMFGSIPACPPDATWMQRAWCGTSPDRPVAVKFLCTANMMVKRDVFSRVQGFDETLKTGEDYDLCQRVLRCGYGIMHDGRISVTHLRYPKTLIGRFLKEIWYGKETFAILGAKPWYKPFWASLAMGLSELGLLASFMRRGFRLSMPVGIFLALLPALSVMSAWYKAPPSRRAAHLAPLSAIFFFYLNGRFVSLFPALLHELKRSAGQARGLKGGFQSALPASPPQSAPAGDREVK